MGLTKIDLYQSKGFFVIQHQKASIKVHIFKVYNKFNAMKILSFDHKGKKVEFEPKTVKVDEFTTIKHHEINIKLKLTEIKGRRVFLELKTEQIILPAGVWDCAQISTRMLPPLMRLKILDVNSEIAHLLQIHVVPETRKSILVLMVTNDFLNKIKQNLHTGVQCWNVKTELGHCLVMEFRNENHRKKYINNYFNVTSKYSLINH